MEIHKKLPRPNPAFTRLLHPFLCVFRHPKQWGELGYSSSLISQAPHMCIQLVLFLCNTDALLVLLVIEYCL